MLKMNSAQSSITKRLVPKYRECPVPIYRYQMYKGGHFQLNTCDTLVPNGLGTLALDVYFAIHKKRYLVP